MNQTDNHYTIWISQLPFTSHIQMKNATSFRKRAFLRHIASRKLSTWAKDSDPLLQHTVLHNRLLTSVTNRTKYIWPAKRKPEFHCHQLTMSSTSLFQREREMNSWHSHSQHQNHASFPQITFISTLIPAPSMDPHSRNTLLWQPISSRTQLLYKQIKRPNFQQVYDKLGNVLKPFWCS
jgi:hypothetical protein